MSKNTSWKRLFWHGLMGISIFLLSGTVCCYSSEIPVDEMDFQELVVGILLMGATIVCTGYVAMRKYFPEAMGKPMDVSGWVTGCLIFWGVVQAVWGLLQVYDFLPSRHAQFRVTGAFFNPGPYSGFLAMTLPLCVYELLKHRSGWKCYVNIAGMIAMLCVLPAGMSRAAWVAAGVACLLVAGEHYRWAGKLRHYIKRYKARACGGAFVLLAALLISGYGLFQIKQDSASGRLLIWKICLLEMTGQLGKAVPDNAKTFSARYGMAQEAYFARGGYPEDEARVSGTPKYAFNEWIEMAFMKGPGWGVAGVLLAIGSVFLLYKAHLGHLGASLVALFLFACFSYPFSFPAFIAVMACILMPLGLAGSPRSWGVFVVLIAVAGVWELSRQNYRDGRNWGKAAALYRMGEYRMAADLYQELYPALNEKGSFLFEYGHCLYKQGDYAKAKEILERACCFIGDPMVLNILGRCEQAMGHCMSAERYFISSANRLPNRFYPYYLLAKLYASPMYFNKEKFVKIYEEIQHKQVKVQSTAIQEMKIELEKIKKALDVKK